LDQICKSFERNKKTENKKRNRTKKRRGSQSLGRTRGPRPSNQPEAGFSPRLPSPTLVSSPFLFFFLRADRWDHHVRFFFPVITPSLSLETAGVNPSAIPRSNGHQALLYKSPARLLLRPLFPLLKSPQGWGISRRRSTHLLR
jgi:hypothetical protein